MTNTNFNISDIQIVCNFMIFRDIQAVDQLTAAADTQVINSLIDKVDPSILEATNQAALTMSNIASNTLIS